MKKAGLGILLLFSFVGFAAAETIDETVVSVQLTKTEIISELKLEQAYQFALNQAKAQSAQTGQAPQEIAKGDVLNLLISMILLEQGAERDGVEISDTELDKVLGQERAQFEVLKQQQNIPYTYENYIETQFGISFSDYRENIRKSKLKEKYIGVKKRDQLQAQANVEDELIQRTYEAEMSNLTIPTYVKIQHIVKSKEGDSAAQDLAKKSIDRLYSRLESGSASFEDLVLDSSDDKVAIQQGGRYIFINDPNARKFFGDAFVTELFNMEAGEVSQVLESNVGYHIVRVEEQVKAHIAELDEPRVPGNPMTVRDAIKQQLMMRKLQMAYNVAFAQLVGELREEAEITYYKQEYDPEI